MNELDFDARFALLIEAETLARDNKRLQKLPHDAKLRIRSACVEDLDQLACRMGFRVLHHRVPRLFEELALAHADGTYTRLLNRFAKVDVLILDDWGLAPLDDQQRRDVLEIIEDRHGSRSTIVTSQLRIETWHDYIGHPTIAGAVLDRLVHDAHKLAMKGPSRRKEKAPNA